MGKHRIFEDSVGIALSSARIRAKLSQEYMAQELDVSKKTVISWEKGVSCPPIDRAFEWFEVCNANPLAYFLKVLWPETKADATASDADIEAEFAKLSTLLPSSTKRALLFVFFGKHNSSPDALIQMLLAYLHTPLTARATQAITSANMYKLVKELNHDPCPDGIQPNIYTLENAINDARVEILRQSERRK